MPYAITNTCNFNCSFCDKQGADPDSLSKETILRDAPLSELSGLRAILSGGEPTLHPRLPGLLEGLKKQKVRNISLRTNAAWASKEHLVLYLKKRGLTEVSVLFPTFDPVLFDSLVRKKEAYQTVIEGIRNLQQHKIAIVLRIPILKPTLNDLPSMLDMIPQAIGKIKRIDLVYMDMVNTDLQVPFDAINAILPFGSAHPNRNLPPICLDPGPGIAFCWTERMKQWTITPDCPTAKGGFSEKCNSCFMQAGCPGIPNNHQRLRKDDVQPIHSPIQEGTQGYTGLKILKDAPFEDKKGVTFECQESGEAPTLASMRLRVGHQCNRRCEFCFIPHHEKSVQDYDIEKSIDAAVKAGVRELVMTGGEPTLQNDLPVYIQQASSLGVRRIVLQTNGMRLANEAYAQKLIDAGLTSVVVSLHSHLDEVLSAITSVPNALSRILKGIRNLHRAGIQVSLTHVIGPKNYDKMPEFAKFMVEEAGVNRFCFIFATPMSWAMAKKEIVVRYSDAAPYVMKAMDYCIEKGVIVDGLAFKCGAPHCVVNGEPKYLVDAVPIPQNNRSMDWVRVPACKTCVLKDQCYGVRRLYVWLYGVEEFKPILDPAKRIDHVGQGGGRPEGSNPFPHKVLPRRVPADEVHDLLSQATTQLSLPKAMVHRFTSAVSIAPISSGEKKIGFRVTHDCLPANHPTMGSVEVQSNAEQAKMQAILRSLRALAFDVPLLGAHGSIADANHLSEYADILSAQSTGRVDLLTPHTSLPQLERLQRPPSSNVQVVRQADFSVQHHLRMTSIDSTICLLALAIEGRQVTDTTIRYAVWGYGKAGQAFAQRVDQVELRDCNQKIIRAKMIACADSKSSWIDEHGLEHERITSFKHRNGKLPFNSARPPSDALYADCDCLLLCGKGTPLRQEDVARVQAAIVIDLTGSVNADVERALRARGIDFFPSMLATSGPFILSLFEIVHNELPWSEHLAHLSIPVDPELTVRQRYLALLKSQLRTLLNSIQPFTGDTITSGVVALALRNWHKRLQLEREDIGHV